MYSFSEATLISVHCLAVETFAHSDALCILSSLFTFALAETRNLHASSITDGIRLISLMLHIPSRGVTLDGHHRRSCCRRGGGSFTTHGEIAVGWETAQMDTAGTFTPITHRSAQFRAAIQLGLP